MANGNPPKNNGFYKAKIGRREAKSEHNSAEQKSRNAIEKNPSKSNEKQTVLIEKQWFRNLSLRVILRLR